MTILKRLTLNNFRQYESYSIEFEDKVTVLVGANGAGKSSILDAAAVALGTFFLPFPTVNQKRAIHADDATVFTKRTGEDHVESRSIFPVEIEAQGDFDNRTITWKRTKNSAKGNTTYKYARELVDISSELYERLAGRSEEPEIDLPIISYYGTGRLWAQKRGKGKGILKSPGKREDGYSSALDPRADEKSMIQWIKRATLIGLQKNRIPSTLQAVQDAVSFALCSVSGANDARVFYDLELDLIVVEYQKNHERPVSLPMNQLSDGYRTTLGMIADIAYRMAELNPHFGRDVLKKTSGVVLIDEIDLHLHPNWQQRIIQDLVHLFPLVQFIVTTHAPSVINSVYRNQIRIIDNECNVAQVPHTETFGRDILSIYNHVMKASSRPEEVLRTFDLIDDAILDSEYDKAKELISELKERIGEGDPEITSFETEMFLEGQ